MKTKEQRYVYFGEYPQTIKADDVEITEIQDERGYYLGTDGYYYAKVISTPYNYHIVVKQDRPSLPMKERETYRLIEREYIFDLYGDKLIFPELEAICFDKLRHIPNVDSYRFSDGRVILPAIEYFFKVEPIKWSIISEGTDNSFMLSDYVIDTPTSIMKYLFEMYYDIYRGRGQRIEDAVGNAIAEAKRLAVKDKIRHWAENIFYKTGFSDGELNSIIDDKLVSYKDLEFLSDFTTRVPTDYALAKGVQLHGGYYGNACAWWLYGCDYLVYFDGKPRKCTFRPQDYFQVGILPSLKLKKEIDEKEQRKYIKDFNKAIEERKAEAEKWVETETM